MAKVCAPLVSGVTPSLDELKPIKEGKKKSIYVAKGENLYNANQVGKKTLERASKGT